MTAAMVADPTIMAVMATIMKTIFTVAVDVGMVTMVIMGEGSKNSFIVCGLPY